MDQGKELLHQNFAALRAEAVHILATRPMKHITRSKTFDRQLLQSGQDCWLMGWTGKPDWLNYGLVYDSTAVNVESTPVGQCIIRQLQRITGRRVVMAGYSLLKAGSVIGMHRDNNNEHVQPNVLHFGLIVPSAGCNLLIGNQPHKEADNRVIMFDDGLPHAAENCSTQDRTILYVQFRTR
jgi:hypothetical protein